MTLLVSGCSSDADSAVQDAPAAAATTSESASASEVSESPADQALPGPVFETVSGAQFDLNSLEGTDTVLWFWAPW